MIIRDEEPADIDAVRAVIAAAFEKLPLSNQMESVIVDRLRSSDALTLSLVALEDGRVAGHIAFSGVTIAAQKSDWYGLGPVAVRPDCQGRGIGQALIRTGLQRLETLGAQGCVVVGEPGYYQRFGFKPCPRLTFSGVPPEFFFALPFSADTPEGSVEYHAAFA